MPVETSMMLSHPKEPEISSGSVAVSKDDSASKSHKQDKKRMETPQSPFKVPDNKHIFLLSVNEKGDQKEEMRKFLALPIGEKPTHAARMMAKVKKERKELAGELEVEKKEEEEEEKTENQNSIKSKATLPKHMTGRHELKMAMMKRENFTKESKHDLISMERQKAVLELVLMTKKSEILKMDMAIAQEERQLEQLEEIIERDNLKFEEFLRENEKKSVEARTFFEQEAKSKQEKNAEIKRLNAEIWTIKSELDKFEEILIDYKTYKELLFKLSPPEWQEAQKAKPIKTKVLSDKDTLGEHNRDESASRHGLESKLSNPGKEVTISSEASLSSVHSNALDSPEYEDEPELYFTDPQQLLDLMTVLKEQNLSLIQNCARLEETVDELRQYMETTRMKIAKDEEQLARQKNGINQGADKEKAKGNKLQQKVQLHVSLNTDDQDVMLEALSEKVAEVHRSCVDDRMTNLSTSEKLASIESRLSLLQMGLESIPKEILETMKKIKDSERRSREREEKLREQKEKQKERMRRYLERSLADSKKTSGRKLMPRCMPATQKIKVSKVDNSSAEDEIHAYLYTSDDIE